VGALLEQIGELTICNFGSMYLRMPEIKMTEQNWFAKIVFVVPVLLTCYFSEEFWISPKMQFYVAAVIVIVIFDSFFLRQLAKFRKSDRDKTDDFK
jgi:hypothetical protein